jgi:hypothetical protein
LSAVDHDFLDEFRRRMRREATGNKVTAHPPFRV